MKTDDVIIIERPCEATTKLHMYCNKYNNRGYRALKLWNYLALAIILLIFGCKQKNNGKGSKATIPPSSNEIIITVRGDSNLRLKTPNTFKTNKDFTWKDIKQKAKDKITLKENQKIKEWRISHARGAVLKDSDKFEEDETVFAVSEEEILQGIIITIKADQGYKFKDGKNESSLEIEKGTRWANTKGKAEEKIELLSSYDKAGWKLGGKYGSYIDDGFVFGENATVYAISKKKGEPEVEKLTITVAGDGGIELVAGKTFQVDKGSKWENIKAQAISKASAKVHFEIKEWRIKDARGAVLRDSDKFEKDETVFAVSEKKISQEITVTIKGDERVKVLGAEYINIAKGKTFGEVKTCIEEKVRLADNWPSNYYEFYDWRIDDEEGEEILDSTQIFDNITVYARTNYKCFNILENKELESYTGEPPRWRIFLPKEIESIGGNAFSFCDNLSVVDLSSCVKLKTIRVEKIENHIITGAFAVCSRLKSVNLSGCGALTSIGDMAFHGCRKLNSINLSGCSKLSSIGDNAFSGCTSLESIDLSPCTKLASIGAWVFVNCVKAKIILPASITEIKSNAFGYDSATWCDRVYVPNGNATIRKLVIDSGYPENRIKEY